MAAAVVVVWHPSIVEDQKGEVFVRVKRRLATMNIVSKHVVFNSNIEYLKKIIGGTKVPLFALWIQHQSPPWLEVLVSECDKSRKSLFVLFSQQHDTTDKPQPSSALIAPTTPMNKDELHLRKLKQFDEGWFVASSKAPYGLRKTVSPFPADDSSPRSRPLKALLAPGDAQEVEIVRLIFDLYACQKVPMKHIVNMLNAEGVPPRGAARRWRSPNVRSIIENPHYVGANSYKRHLTPEVFPAIVEPWLFHAAQARLHFTRRSWAPSFDGFDPIEKSGGGDDHEC